MFSNVMFSNVMFSNVMFSNVMFSNVLQHFLVELYFDLFSHEVCEI